MPAESTRWLSLQRLVLLALAVAVGIWQGPRFAGSLTTPRGEIRDFMQEWASAKNYLRGLPVYMNQGNAIEEHLGVKRDRTAKYDRFFIEVNAHPPSSVLLSVPLARLDYPDAFLTWNIISLAALLVSAVLMQQQLGFLRNPLDWFVVLGLLLLYAPLRLQVHYGQLNLILLLLVTGGWAARRSGMPELAGLLLGLATVIKLFPGFLLLYLAWRREWRAFFAGLTCVALTTLLTVLILGPQTYVSFINEVLPQTIPGSGPNASLTGFGYKLFWPDPRQHILPLTQNRLLAQATSWTLILIIVGVLAWLTRRLGDLRERDLAFALATIAMLLVSPLTWAHSFVLLLLPFAILWKWLPASILWRGLLALVAVPLALDPAEVFSFWYGWPDVPAGPATTVTVLSFQCYALLACFTLTAAALLARVPDSRAEALESALESAIQSSSRATAKER